MDDRHFPCFFLGANAPRGFYSCFASMYTPDDDWKCTILKGGPGSGKSTILKQTAAAAAQQGQRVEYIYCSSDPRSLDAVILPDAHRCMVDGTAPHVVEPQYPGACESLFNPGDYWDTDALYAHRTEIRALGRQIAACHRRSAAVRAALSAVASEVRLRAQEAARISELHRYAQRLAARTVRRPADGGITERFLSGFTPDGLLRFDPTLRVYADTVTRIDDPYGAVAPCILDALRSRAAELGAPAILCRSPLDPETLEAVILPAERCAFVADGALTRLAFAPTHTIHARRFLDPIAHGSIRPLLRARLKTMRALSDDACAELHRALRLHDRLEAYYMEAMDFRKLTRAADGMIARFLR